MPDCFQQQAESYTTPVDFREVMPQPQQRVCLRGIKPITQERQGGT